MVPKEASPSITHDEPRVSGPALPWLSRPGVSLTLFGLLVLYAASRFLQVFPGNIPMLAIVALHVCCPAIFALIHGALRYGARGILIFLLLCLLMGNLFESLSVLTGFPYGHYYFTEVMGPKLFVVPVLLGLAYLGMGYLSWTLAGLILAETCRPLVGSRVVTLPLVASFVMVAWDLSMDPIWSTCVGAWIWLDGGAYFGVPVSNFFGWYLTVYLSYQLFALSRRGRLSNDNPLPRGYWHLAVLFYGISAAGNLLLLIPQTSTSLVSDPAGVQWRVNDITTACALNSVFTMGAFALMAWVRLVEGEAQTAATGNV
jgi:uncharacterized membrane protein